VVHPVVGLDNEVDQDEGEDLSVVHSVLCVVVLAGLHSIDNQVKVNRFQYIQIRKWRTQKETKKRLLVIRELVDTENTYSKSLNILVEQYVKVISEKSLLPQDQMYIFDNLPVMAKISSQLLADLQERLEAWESSGSVKDSNSLCISDVFTPLLPFMKMYASYRNQVDFNHMGDLYETYPKFDDFCAKIHNDPAGGGQSLDSLLIMPIQRIPRYILLLETLIKYTEPTHSDYEGLHNALSLVKDVAGHVNSAHAQVDNGMFTLAVRFGENFDELMEPWRTIIGEITLKTVSSKKNNKQLLILLTDHIVLATAQKKPKWKGKMHLAKCWLIDVADIEEYQHLFTIYCPSENIKTTFSCASAEEKETWLKKLAEQIEKTVNDPRVDSDLRSSAFDQTRLNQKKGSDPFFNNPQKVLLSSDEFHFLETIVKEFEITEAKKKEKEKRETKLSRKESSPGFNRRATEAKKTAGSIDNRIAMYKQATSSGTPPPSGSRTKAPKMKNKQVKHIKSSMNHQRKLAKSSSRTTANVIKQGHLTKKGALVKNWKDRYWILSYATLSYYKSSKDSEPVGEIKLRGCEVRNAPDSAEDKCYFELVAPFRTYFLKANSEELCKEWMAAISHQISQLVRGNVVKEGFLTKQGKVRKNWKKRYCVLTPTSLQYFKSKGDTKAAGSVPVVGASVDSVSKKDTGKDYCFSITTTGRTFLMYSESEDQKDEWMQAISNC